MRIRYGFRAPICKMIEQQNQKVLDESAKIRRQSPVSDICHM